MPNIIESPNEECERGQILDLASLFFYAMDAQTGPPPEQGRWIDGEGQHVFGPETWLSRPSPRHGHEDVWPSSSCPMPGARPS